MGFEARGYAPYSSCIDGVPKYKSNRLYLGNKMTGISCFNAAWFDAQAARLKALPCVDYVFNPADHDRERGFHPEYCPNGSKEEAEEAGFEAHVALREDYTWICDHSDGLIVGPDWDTSRGTISEIAVHQALGLPVWEFAVFMQLWDKDHLYELRLPPIMELGPRPRAQAQQAYRPLSPFRPWESY